MTTNHPFDEEGISSTAVMSNAMKLMNSATHKYTTVNMYSHMATRQPHTSTSTRSSSSRHFFIYGVDGIRMLE